MLGKIFNAINPVKVVSQAVNAFGELAKGNIGGAIKNAAPLIPGPVGQVASLLLNGQGGGGIPGAAASLLGGLGGKGNPAASLLGGLGNNGNPAASLLGGLALGGVTNRNPSGSLFGGQGLGASQSPIVTMLLQAQQQPGGTGDLARTLITSLQNRSISEKDLLPLLRTLAGQQVGAQQTDALDEDDEEEEVEPKRPQLLA